MGKHRGSGRNTGSGHGARRGGHSGRGGGHEKGGCLAMTLALIVIVVTLAMLAGAA